ncbi:ATPase family protein associated with various cellular activities (AAA) [Thermodesulfitimonas autotrophica]|uniref:ATPase family protein associated with various cellular activities (AAA) n=1 Tax=Thermodesulfitimonas autotrophica TaxID=1894989 RepID=A0A3N5AAY1_9THEO|nr:AAA family ATPase [Thermodesulfitimonas autotrophica]RPF42006.1 ATPase family protein associated with various cellular activities (AAA) [Thermodesulfitimonas autotrophica]
MNPMTYVFFTILLPALRLTWPFLVTSILFDAVFHVGSTASTVAAFAAEGAYLFYLYRSQRHVFGPFVLRWWPFGVGALAAGALLKAGSGPLALLALLVAGGYYYLYWQHVYRERYEPPPEAGAFLPGCGLPPYEQAQVNAEAARRIAASAQAGGGVAAREETVEDVWREIESLVGLGPVKDALRRVVALVVADRERREQGLPPLRQTLHMAFLGNPGTGKTTVARLVGRLFRALEVLPSGHLVETDRSGLVAGYIGQTALKTQEVVKRALGGVLFVDEAYSLARGGEQDFGREALDALIKAMEDRREDLCVILAGYTDEMRELFKLNPGMESRIAFTLEFPDYTPEELLEIAGLYASKRGWRLTPEAEKVLLERFRRDAYRIGEMGNGRFARNLVEKAEQAAALRIARGEGGVDVLTAEDFAE